MQCSSHGALAMHSHAEPTSYSLSQCTLHIVQLLRSSYQQRLCPSLSRGTFNAVQLSWALSIQCSSHGHFQCSAALMGTFNAVQLSWALSMQCSSHGHFQCSAALRALLMQCSAQGTFNAVQCSGHFQCSAALMGILCNGVHAALVLHIAVQLSQSTNTSQQVTLHEALVEHFTMQLSQSTDASASGTALSSCGALHSVTHTEH